MEQCLHTYHDSSEQSNLEVADCTISKFEYLVKNIDHANYFKLRMGMAAFTAITVIFSVLVLGIVWHYERFGGDPQKRTILNQLIGMLAINNLALQNFALMVLSIRLIFGPLSLAEAMIAFLAPSVVSSLVVMFILNEIIIIRCCTVVLLKQLLRINDDFLASFIKLANYGIAFLFVTFGHVGGVPNDDFIFLLTDVYYCREPLLSAAK